ncbi:MAG: ATP-dependent exonuclease, partial [Pseudomonadota bacterium]
EVASYFTMPVFDPVMLPLLPVERLPSDLPAAVGSDAEAIAEGIALHLLLERLTHGRTWPIVVPEAAVLVRWLPCPLALAGVIRAQAQVILTQVRLERFFNPAQYVFARNEMEAIVDGQLLRFDRVVGFRDEVWILDYKRNLLESQLAEYREQLRRYREASKLLFGGKTIKTALITVDGRFWPMDE